MKAQDIRENYPNIDELEAFEKELSRKLWKARFDNHTNQLDETSEIKKVRRDLARVKTLLTEKRTQLEAEQSGQAENS